MNRNPGICRLYAFASCGSLIAYSDDLATFEGTQIAHNIRPPITVADDTKLNHGVHLMRLFDYESADRWQRSWHRSWHGIP